MVGRGWLIIGLLLAWLLAACQGESPVEANCDGSGETAVSLTLFDEDDQPMQRVTVRYRVDGGAWQDLPERVNEETLIPGTAGAGTYEIMAQKQGYETVETAVTVPAAENCGVVPQPLTLTFTRKACPITPRPLALHLDTPTDLLDLQVWGKTPTDGRQALTCTANDTGSCAYLLSLSEVGEYELVVEGLPGNGRMSVNNDVVAYTYIPFDLRLTQGMREQHITGEGADQVAISVPVRPDEINCPLAALDDLTSTLTPDRREDGESVWVNLVGGLTITDLSADDCQAQPQIMPIPYNVTVPAGTHLADVSVLYWLKGKWETAVCQFQESQFTCTAMLPNPLIGQSYAVKAVVNGEEFVSMQMPFDNLCYLFSVEPFED